jgi:hypothetical protein
MPHRPEPSRFTSLISRITLSLLPLCNASSRPPSWYGVVVHLSACLWLRLTFQTLRSCVSKLQTSFVLHRSISGPSLRSAFLAHLCVVFWPSFLSSFERLTESVGRRLSSPNGEIPFWLFSAPRLRAASCHAPNGL